MAERIVGRPWTDEEDKLLREAVRNYGEHDNWKNIALSVPGRTNKACRKRWLHSLSPTVKKSAWTLDEDSRLLELYAVYGSKWSTIARQIPGRTDDACSKRYREALDPNLKKDEWTPDEDVKLMQVFARIGGKWGQVGQELQRSGLGCRNRWRLLERKKASRQAAEQVTNQILDPRGSQISQTEIVNITVIPDEVPPQSHWPPYYPPDAYISFPTDEDSQMHHSFREPSPSNTIPLLPHTAPFQFSSSSLSAALSDPPQLPRPLPTTESPPNPEPLAPSPPSPPQSAIPDDTTDEPMSLDDFSPQNDEQYHDPPHISPISRFNTQTFFLAMQESGAVFPSIGPVSHDGHWRKTINDPLPQGILSLHFPQTPQSLDNTTLDPHGRDDLSSASSTPFGFPSSLSPISSPNPISPAELPTSEHSSSSGSLLFSSNSRSTSSKRLRKVPSKRPTKPQGPRLSSMLPLTSDPNVRPYACGREVCWPVGNLASQVSFATSKELFDHSKNDHTDDSPGERPFRCALAGCGKSWKSLNGLQYHLQISTAHFRDALSTSFSARRTTNTGEHTPVTGSSSEPEGSDDAKRIHVCHHVQCFKAYRQPSGLRYHLKHGHPQEMPVQLSVVPPALARQMPAKTKKMRQKASSETDP